jgi:hypothetical protein
VTSRLPRRAAGLALVAALVSAAATGCGGGSHSPSAADIRTYVSAVQEVRLPVNNLLEGADPILAAYHDHRITPRRAAARMSRLEISFASYTVQMQEIRPSNPVLAALNTPYARTYFYEDSYLATLASDLREGDFDNLPDTQDAQRLAIVIWRTRLDVVANQAGLTLPANLQQAGRGEIAPGPEGS